MERPHPAGSVCDHKDSELELAKLLLEFSGDRVLQIALYFLSRRKPFVPKSTPRSGERPLRRANVDIPVRMRRSCCQEVY